MRLSALILFYSLIACGQNPGLEVFKLIKNNPDKSKAVFVGESHAVKEYQDFSSTLFTALIKSDKQYNVYFELPFSANYLHKEYLETGNDQSLKKLEEIVFTDKGYKYNKNFIISFLKKIRKINNNGGSVNVYFLDVVHSLQMAKALIKDRLKFDSLPSIVDSAFISDEFINEIILQVKNVQKDFADVWLRDLLSSYYPNIGKDTVIQYRDRVMFRHFKEVYKPNTKCFFVLGIAHIKHSATKRTSPTLFQLITDSCIPKKNSTSIILCSAGRKDINLPDFTAVQYGLNESYLNRKPSVVFKEQSLPKPPAIETDKVDYVVLFKCVNLLFKAYSK